MARFEIDAEFPDGERIIVRAVGASNYPDALAQLRAEATNGLKEAVEFLRVPESSDELDEP